LAIALSYHNLAPAAEAGMATIHHIGSVATAQELERVSGIELE
jgi:hypothetical protein